MARITFTDSGVRVKLTVADQIWSLHGSLEIPFDHIVAAKVEDEDGWAHMWRKIAGSTIPGFKLAGWFWFDGGLAFVNYGDGKDCVVIETVHETYKHVVVELESDQAPAPIVAEIERRKLPPDNI